MPVILVLVDDAARDDNPARDPLLETLRRLFPWARVVAVRADLALPLIASKGATAVVANLSTAERLCREAVPPGVPVVALTRDMSPDTLLRAETLGGREVRHHGRRPLARDERERKIRTHRYHTRPRE